MLKSAMKTKIVIASVISFLIGYFAQGFVVSGSTTHVLVAEPGVYAIQVIGGSQTMSYFEGSRDIGTVGVFRACKNVDYDVLFNSAFSEENSSTTNSLQGEYCLASIQR